MESELTGLGYQIVGLSADQPAKMRETAQRHEMTWTVLSDASAAASEAFGLAFRVDDQTFQRYNGFGIDLEAASGKTHHILPVPAVFVVDQKGKIVFEYVNPDYRVRIPASLVVAAAKSALE